MGTAAEEGGPLGQRGVGTGGFVFLLIDNNYSYLINSFFFSFEKSLTFLLIAIIEFQSSHLIKSPAMLVKK